MAAATASSGESLSPHELLLKGSVEKAEEELKRTATGS